MKAILSSVRFVIASLVVCLLSGTLIANGNLGLTRIALGFCAKQNLPQPIWEPILASRPDLFIFLGDNIYGDSKDMEVIQRKYAQLAAKPGFQNSENTFLYWLSGMIMTMAPMTQDLNIL